MLSEITTGLPFVKRTALCVAIISLVGCTEELGELSSYDLAGSCKTIPEITAPDTDPVFTDGPVTDASSLMGAVRFDYSERVAGAIPGPATGTGLIFNNLVVTDKSIQDLFLSGTVPDGKRIGAFFFAIDGTGEYLAVPIEPGGATGSTTGQPVQVVFKGPFPDPATDPPVDDIITNQIIANITVKAFLVDVDADAPDVSTPTFDGAADAANWILPASALTITAENVGTGGFTATMFWNTATDVDLWLIEPDGHKIYYADKNSVAGDGFLDFDNTSGFGPENIFFTNNIPSGQYSIQVNYFSGAPTVTNWSISLSACGSVRAFNGTLTSPSETQDVFTFIYGDDCSILPAPDSPQTPSIFEEVVLCDPAVLSSLEE